MNNSLVWNGKHLACTLSNYILNCKRVYSETPASSLESIIVKYNFLNKTYIEILQISEKLLILLIISALNPDLPCAATAKRIGFSYQWVSHATTNILSFSDNFKFLSRELLSNIGPLRIDNKSSTKTAIDVAQEVLSLNSSNTPPSTMETGDSRKEMSTATESMRSSGGGDNNSQDQQTLSTLAIKKMLELLCDESVTDF